MNKEDAIYYKFFAPLFIFFGVFFGVYMLRGGTDCDFERRMKETTITGVILKRYKDPSQHYTPSLDIRNIQTNNIYTLSLCSEQNGIFERVISGDTIMKQANTLSFQVKNNGEIVEMEFGYNCD